MVLMMLVLCQSLKSQSLGPSVISSYGSLGNGQINMASTLGESVIFTGMSNSNHLTQGFHQPNTFFILYTPEQIKQPFNVKVFPNPFRENVTIEFPNYNGNYFIELIDYNGSLIESSRVNDQLLLNISLYGYPSGIYFLRVQDKDSGQYTNVRMIKL